MKAFKVCSFFGHREIQITEELEKQIKEKLEDMIVNKSYGIFYFGGFGMFDDLCYKIVTKLKKKHSEIRRVFCLSDPRHIEYYKRPKWLQNEEYEEYIYLYLQYDYWYSRIYYRNIEMIKQSDCVIFFVKNFDNGGAHKAYKYAQKIKKENYNFGC